MRKTYTVYCPQCEALVIQMTPCHETGCPLSKREWVKNEKYGFMIPDGEGLPPWAYTDDDNGGADASN